MNAKYYKLFINPLNNTLFLKVTLNHVRLFLTVLDTRYRARYMLKSI